MLLICIIGLIIIFLYYLYDMNYNKSKIIIYSSVELYNQLIYILFDYYHSMSLENLNLRNINNIDEYLVTLPNSFYSPSYYQKKILINAIKATDKYMNSLCFIGFYPKKLKSIPWKVGFVKSNNYEFGMPHTQGDVIILHINNLYINKLDLIILLIHERIHIYQKLFPEDVDEFIQYYNFRRIGHKQNNDRHNPDTDNYIYEMSPTSNNPIIYECKINDSNGVVCTYDDPVFEHPYEYMAYMISESIKE